MEKENTATVEYKPTDYDMAVPCVICGTFVRLNECERGSVLAGRGRAKVCRECKAAVAFMKKKMQNDG